MSFHGTLAALGALMLTACANAPPPAVSQGAVSLVMAPAPEEPGGTPEFHAARIGRDALRSRIAD